MIIMQPIHRDEPPESASAEVKEAYLKLEIELLKNKFKQIKAIVTNKLNLSFDVTGRLKEIDEILESR